MNTGACYVATTDVDALCARARLAGATIVSEPHDTEFGSRDFTACDGEGYVWHFGTYHPGVEPPAPGDRERSSPPVEAEVFDAIRYDDAPAALAWLVSAFGFEEHARYGSDPFVAHALLRFGRSLLIASTTRPDDPLKLKPPARAGGRTQTIYVVVPDSGRALRARESSGRRGAPVSDGHALGRPPLRGGRSRGLRLVLLELRAQGAAADSVVPLSTVRFDWPAHGASRLDPVPW